MENIIDLIAADASPNEISDSIKNAIFLKSAEKIDQVRPIIASSLFSEYEEGVEQAGEEPEE